MRRLAFSLAVLLIGVFTGNAICYAAGTAIYDQGAAAMGKGVAFAAQADDASAVYYNPAGITQLKGTHFSLGTTLISPQIDYEAAPGGSDSEEKDQVFFPSTFYATHTINDRLSAGFGIFTPFGLETEWPTGWDGRFIVTSSQINTYFLNPVISWQAVPEKLSLSAGFNYAYGDFSLERQINLSQVTEENFTVPALENPEGKVKMDGQGNGYGYNLALLYHITDAISFGASYRSKIDIDIDDGDADFTIPSSPGSIVLPVSTDVTALVASAFPDGDASTTLKLPSVLFLGLGTTAIKNWQLEFDVIWTRWSVADEISIDFESGLPTEVIPLDWNNSFLYAIGAEYRWSELLKLRFGYSYDVSPVPDGTFTPIIPDNNRHNVNIGMGWGTTPFMNGMLNVDLAYQAIFIEERNKENEVGSNFSSDGITGLIPAIDARANGEYEGFVHLAGVNLSYLF